MKTVSQRHMNWYLANTERGVSMRELSRIAGVHCSSVSRAIRLVEDARGVDDSLPKVKGQPNGKPAPTPHSNTSSLPPLPLPLSTL